MSPPKKKSSLSSFYRNYYQTPHGEVVLHGQRIDPRILEAKKRLEEEGGGERGEEEHPDIPDSDLLTVKGFRNLREINLSNYPTRTWEDADTLILQGSGDPVKIRLSGIDAPEISHGDEEGRWHQAMPRGEESTRAVEEFTEDKNLRVFIDPSQRTYGRYIGSIFADETNVNIEEIRRGWAAALPWGESGSDIFPRKLLTEEEEGAVSRGEGMWQEPYFQKYRQVSQAMGGRVTFNTLTEMGRLAKNLNLAAMEQYLYGNQPINPLGEEIGRSLKRSYGRFFHPHKGLRFSSRDDDYNTIEALPHGGLAGVMRKEDTDFGSGYDILRAIAKDMKVTFGSLVESKEWKKALAKGKKVRRVGEGLFGEVEEWKTTFMGREFSYAKKIQRPRRQLEKDIRQQLGFGNGRLAPNEKKTVEDAIKEGSVYKEIKFYKELGETPLVPSYYGRLKTRFFRRNSIYMEFMPGKEVMKVPRGTVVEEHVYSDITQTIDVMKQKNISNMDIHTRNIMYGWDERLQKNRLSWIDVGQAEYVDPADMPAYANRMKSKFEMSMRPELFPKFEEARRARDAARQARDAAANQAVLDAAAVYQGPPPPSRVGTGAACPRAKRAAAAQAVAQAQAQIAQAGNSGGRRHVIRVAQAGVEPIDQFGRTSVDPFGRTHVGR